MTPVIARWYVRCLHCLTIGAISTRPDPDLVCGACGGPVEDMGQVQESLLVDVRPGERTPCDDRCTNATGPLCVCRCGGVNHGCNRLVIMGNGKVALPNADAMLIAQDYRNGLARLSRLIDVLRAQQRNGQLLNHADYQKLKQAEKAFRLATEARTQKARMKILNGIA